MRGSSFTQAPGLLMCLLIAAFTAISQLLFLSGVFGWPTIVRLWCGPPASLRIGCPCGGCLPVVQSAVAASAQGPPSRKVLLFRTRLPRPDCRQHAKVPTEGPRVRKHCLVSTFPHLSHLLSPKSHAERLEGVRARGGGQGICSHSGSFPAGSGGMAACLD